MDKNQSIGLLLIASILLAYTFFFAPEPEKENQDGATPVAENVDQLPSNNEIEQIENKFDNLSDSVKNARYSQRYGVFASAVEGENRDFILENDVVKITFSSKGAGIDNVLLKKFKTWDQRPLNLLKSGQNDFSMELKTSSGTVDLSKLYFATNASQVTTVASGGKSSISFKLKVDEQNYIEQVYTLGEGYELENKFYIKGLENVITGNDLQYVWQDNLTRAEKNLYGNSGERGNTTVNFYTTSGTFDDLSATSEDAEEEKVTEPVNWIAFKQQFFVSSVIPSSPVSNAVVSTELPSSLDTMVVKKAKASFAVPVKDLRGGTDNFKYYFGPNNYDILKDVTTDFSRNLNLGWGIFGWVNKFVVIPIFNFLQMYISSYGLIILILVLIIKLALAPLSYKSYLSMAKMRVLKPELDEIKAEAGDDMAKAQTMQMELYRKVGVNPLSGCVPMLLQMPILFAMFRFFPNSIELRQESFLWAHDLSTYDTILQLPFEIPFYGSHVSGFGLLMTISLILYTWMNSQTTTVEGPAKTMQYMMPVMFLFIGNNFPAGLTYYYCLSNIVTFGQQAIIRKFVDDDKIHSMLQENKKKNVSKKKSKFQQKLDEAMKANNQANKNKKKN
ncbi:membrane protein insertase YidC [Aureibacter tunicatorum]|uniref:Membrane protein insertase YidC n=1 Tax=Aureibacter tunicatorum TaxID=866807 RepID=A0AAE3XKQ2_9BACT|nr:membrane protein insertase YidC [Aureibacter tunicatorum]MDR6239616.1 YidC/Oxa1 family membrane protein insertase [Aureibacter tunicatorum]BDD04093.1 membrane protein insertase YidC [Aureibacter tunicatorum]